MYDLFLKILKALGRPSLQDVTVATLEPINFPEIAMRPLSLHHSLIIYCVMIEKYVQWYCSSVFLEHWLQSSQQ